MNVTLRFLPISVLMLAACGSTASTATTTPTSAPATTVPVSSTTSTSTTSPSTTGPTTTNAGTTTTVKVDEQAQVVYLVHDDHLVVAGRQLGTWDASAVLQALIAGPTAAEAARGITTRVPPATTVNSVSVEASTAVVDLSSAFLGAASATATNLRLGQLVFTLTTLPGVDAVEVKVDGVVQRNFPGSTLATDPATRAELYGSVLPHIFLEDPYDGAKLAQPLVFAGMTDAFEATINFRVIASDGTVVAKGILTATCGTGCWGTFHTSVTLPASVHAPVRLQVYDISSKDSSEIDLQEITLT